MKNILVPVAANAAPILAYAIQMAQDFGSTIYGQMRSLKTLTPPILEILKPNASKIR